MFYPGTGNVLLHKESELNDPNRVPLPSHLVVDGNTEQPSCVDFSSFPENLKLDFIVKLLNDTTIRYVKMDLLSIHRGRYNVFLKV
jgi:hypothetical protein